MAVQSTQSNLPSLSTILSSTFLNPLITGPLLLYLQRNPSLLERIPWPPVRYYKLPAALTKMIVLPERIRVGATPPLQSLKFLFTWGLLLYGNRLFNRLALNYGHFSKQGEPWEFDVEGREVVVVTGGCSGFGKEMVKMFDQRTKAKIIVLDVVELPEELKYIQRLSYHKVDLSSTESIHSTIETLLRTTTPTVLINNAGIAQEHSILNTSDAYLEKVFHVNVMSHFTLIRLILPHMMRQRKGHIVSLASMASYTGCAGIGDYCATKHAVLGMHESLIAELGERYKDQGGHCIQASIVHPMWARTPLVGSWEKALTASKVAVLEPTDVARPVVDHVLRGRSGSVFCPAQMRYATLVKGLPDWIGIRMRRDMAISTDMGKQVASVTEREKANERVQQEDSWVKT